MSNRLQAAAAALSWTHEKMTLVVSTIISASASLLGAALSDGETRWLLATFGASTFASVFLSLGFRRDGETIRLVIGRSGIAVMISMCIIKTAIHYWKLELFNKDIIALILASFAATTFGYLIGYEILSIINRDSVSLSKRIYDWIVRKFIP